MSVFFGQSQAGMRSAVAAGFPQDTMNGNCMRLGAERFSPGEMKRRWKVDEFLFSGRKITGKRRERKEWEW